MFLHLDFEVFSEIDIKKASFELYATHSSTRIILAAYAFDDGAVKVWEPAQGPCPELRAALLDQEITVVAWNTTYERSILAGRGMKIPLERWLDPMILARYAGLPGKLKDCAKVPMINVPPEEKTKNETLLINKFCRPQKDGRVIKAEDSPEDWALFVDYCRKDVLTMRHIHNWLRPRFTLPDRELEIWRLDQRINAAGFPVDVEFARSASDRAKRCKVEALQGLRDLTGLENPNSVQQLLPWLQDRGYQYDSLGREFVEQALEGAEGEYAQVLKLRLESNKSSVKKFDRFVELAHNGRIVNQFTYYGAHTGRWSGRDVQPQNLPREKPDEETMCQLRSNLYQAALDPASEQVGIALSSLPT